MQGYYSGDYWDEADNTDSTDNTYRSNHPYGIDSSEGADNTEAQRLEASGEYQALDSLDRAADRVEQADWVNTGIHDVQVSELPEPEGITGESSFEHLSKEEMRAGMERYQEMRTAIQSGEGASSDYWAEYDRQRGLSYHDGYQNVYDSFYGNDAIRVAKDEDQYVDIINGRHRISLAREMGIDTLPAVVYERRTS